MKVRKIKTESKSSLKTAVKNVQNILKKGNNRIKKLQIKREVVKKKPEIPSEKQSETELKYTSTKGIVVISHIPHGFFEQEMKMFFRQFGKVTKVRVVRSKKSGVSRGYGYIEFETPEVAKIVAETMNNYLMCGRLLKAKYIPPEKQHFGFFFGKGWSEKFYPKLKNRKSEIKLNRAAISEVKHRKCVKKALSNLSTLEKKLKNKGIDLTFNIVKRSKTPEV